MRSLILLALVAGGLSAQERDPDAGKRMFLRVQFADSARDTPMRVRLHGQLFASLGPLRDGKDGTMSLGPGGSATGVIIGELSPRAGEIAFSSGLFGPRLELSVYPDSNAATPRLWARGRRVSVIRDESGQLSVRAGW